MERHIRVAQTRPKPARFVIRDFKIQRRDGGKNVA